MAVGFNSHSIDFHFQSDVECSSDGNLVVNDYFTTDPEGSRESDLDPDITVVGLHSYGLRKGFTLVIGHKYRRWFFERLH